MPDDDELPAGETDRDDGGDHQSLHSQLIGAADRRNIPVGTIVVTVAVVGAAIFGVVLLWVLRTIVLYVVVATFLAVLLAPAVGALERRGARRGLATGVVFFIGVVVFAGLAFLFGYPLITAVDHFASRAPSLVQQAEHGRGGIGRLIERFHLRHWIDTNAPKLSTYARGVAKPALSFGTAALSTIVALTVMAFLSIYVLLELPAIWGGVLRLLPADQARRADRVAKDASRAVSGYVLGDVLTSVVTGLVVFITLEILGVPFAPLLGLWAGLADLLPVVGGAFAYVPAMAVSLLHGGLAGGVIFTIVFVIYLAIENHVLNPLVYARTVKMRPVLVLLAALVGATLGGRLHSGFGVLLGAIMGIPVGSAIQVVVRELRTGSLEPPSPTDTRS